MPVLTVSMTVVTSHSSLGSALHASSLLCLRMRGVLADSGLLFCMAGARQAGGVEVCFSTCQRREGAGRPQAPEKVCIFSCVTA